MKYTDLIFDLYGTLVDIKTNEESVEFWQNIAIELDEDITAANTVRKEYLSACAGYKLADEQEIDLLRVFEDLLALHGKDRRNAKAFAEKFAADPEKVHYVNAGISGTPSRLGITRLEQDVLSKSPDVVFIEFAVNDSNDKQSQMVYESLVRRLLQSETSPAVVLIFTLLNSGYSCQPHMSQIGAYYDLGMISVKNALQPEFTAGRMTFQDYSKDYAHPTTEGHAFIARMIGHYFDQAAATAPAPYTLPETPVIGNFCENLVNIRQGSPLIKAEGSLKADVTPCYSYLKGWKHTMYTGKEPMVLELTGGPLFLVFKQENNPNCGNLEVWVDGTLKKTLNGHSPSAWGNPVTEIIGIGDVTKPHTVELRMAEGDHMKNFSLLDLAYVPGK